MFKPNALAAPALILLLMLPGCAPETAGHDPGQSPPVVAATAAKLTFQWQDAELLLEQITDDVEPQPGFKAPEGKYVIAAVAVQTGRLEFGAFQDVYKQACVLRCGSDSYAPVSLEAKGIQIDGDLAYAVGTLYVYFDIPADADISGASFTMAQ